MEQSISVYLDPTASLDLSLDVAHYFNLENLQAKKITKEVGSAVALWRKEALDFKIKKRRNRQDVFCF